MTQEKVFIIYGIYAFFGLIGIIMDLSQKKHRDEYKGSNIWHTIGFMLLYVFVGGVFVFIGALSDYLEYRKQLQRRPEVMRYIKTLTDPSRLDNSDFNFIWDLKCSTNLGMISNPEFEKLKKIAEGYKLVNTLNK